MTSEVQQKLILACLNLKGGVGKSVLTVGLARAIYLMIRKPVLMLDGDSQGGLTRHATKGVPKRFPNNLGMALDGRCTPSDAVLDLSDPGLGWGDDKAAAQMTREQIAAARAQWKGLLLVPPTTFRVRASMMPTDGQMPFTALRTLAHTIMDEQGVSYAVVDTGHDDSDLTMMTMVSADVIFIVVSARQSQSVAQIAEVSRLLTNARKHEDFRHVRLGGVIITDFDRRELVHKDIVNNLKAAYGDRVVCVLPHRAPIERAIIAGQVFDSMGPAIAPIPELLEEFVTDHILKIK